LRRTIRLRFGGRRLEWPRPLGYENAFAIEMMPARPIEIRR